jgi:hypothetical protein
MGDGTPIKIDDGTLPAMRRELDYRKPLQDTGGFTGLRIRLAGHPYTSCACGACDSDRDPTHPSFEIRPLR